MPRKFLLACGIAAAVLYVGIDVLAAIRYPAYHSFSSRVISELMATGAPTERLVDPLFLIDGVLMLAFAVGVWMSGPERRMHVTAGLLFAFTAIGFLGPTLAEMNMRGSGGDPTADFLHIGLTMGLMVLMIAAMIVAASMRGRWFRNYTYATLGLMVVFGALTAVASRNFDTGEPTPWIGLTERINIWAFQLWVVVLAVSLMRSAEPAKASPTNASGHRMPPLVATR
jgi:hypothetical protein